MQPIGVVEFNNKAGDASWPFWSGRWERLLKRPRIESLFSLDDEGPVCCRLLLPYDAREWEDREADLRLKTLRDAEREFSYFGVASLAWPSWNAPAGDDWHLPVFTGEFFIAALTLVLVRNLLGVSGARRVYLVGHTRYILELLDWISRWQRPVIWSSLFPAQSEIDLHDMLYERGTPAAVAAFRPAAWKADDLVLVFNSMLLPRALTSPARVVDLSQESSGLLGELELLLATQGVDCRLGYLGPVMEAFVNQGQVLSGSPRDSIIKTLAGGCATGLWELFLDNQDYGLYNSLKGLAGYHLG